MKKPHYSRHNLPQVKKEKSSISAIINRKFYQNLRARGRSNQYIFDMIQPERREQFFKDVHDRITVGKPEDNQEKLNWAQKLLKSIF